MDARANAGDGFEARAYVDTGPVQERVYAQYAGLGWIGKNTCVINPTLGSWIFLSEIICSLPLAPDRAGARSVRHLHAVPRGLSDRRACRRPYVLDSRRCLSYLTIEIKGAIPVEHREAIVVARLRLRHLPGGVSVERVAGGVERSCLAARDGLDRPALLDLWQHSDDELRRLLKGSAMKRAGVRRLRRNLAVALGNSGDSSAIRGTRSQARSDL